MMMEKWMREFLAIWRRQPVSSGVTDQWRAE